MKKLFILSIIGLLLTGCSTKTGEFVISGPNELSYTETVVYYDDAVMSDILSLLKDNVRFDYTPDETDRLVQRNDSVLHFLYDDNVWKQYDYTLLETDTKEYFDAICDVKIPASSDKTKCVKFTKDDSGNLITADIADVLTDEELEEYNTRKEEAFADGIDIAIYALQRKQNSLLTNDPRYDLRKASEKYIDAFSDFAVDLVKDNKLEELLSLDVTDVNNRKFLENLDYSKLLDAYFELEKEKYNSPSMVYEFENRGLQIDSIDVERVLSIADANEFYVHKFIIKTIPSEEFISQHLNYIDADKMLQFVANKDEFMNILVSEPNDFGFKNTVTIVLPGTIEENEFVEINDGKVVLTEESFDTINQQIVINTFLEQTVSTKKTNPFIALVLLVFVAIGGVLIYLSTKVDKNGNYR